MTPGDAVMRFLLRYARFSGRAGRSEFWWPVAVLTVFYVTAAVIDSASGRTHITAFVVLFAITPTLAVLTRRLHDTGRSGKVAWVALIPIVGYVILLGLTLVPGSTALNEFGPPPGGTQDPRVEPGRRTPKTELRTASGRSASRVPLDRTSSTPPLNKPSAGSQQASGGTVARPDWEVDPTYTTDP